MNTKGIYIYTDMDRTKQAPKHITHKLGATLRLHHIEREICTYLESTSSEFDADCRFGFQAELIASESREEI